MIGEASLLGGLGEASDHRLLPSWIVHVAPCRPILVFGKQTQAVCFGLDDGRFCAGAVTASLGPFAWRLSDLPVAALEDREMRGLWRSKLAHCLPFERSR